MEQAAQVKSLPGGTALKMINFIYKKISDRMQQSQPAFTTNLHSPSPASLVSMLAYFHKMPILVGQAVKGDMLF